MRKQIVWGLKDKAVLGLDKVPLGNIVNVSVATGISASTGSIRGRLVYRVELGHGVLVLIDNDDYDPWVVGKGFLRNVNPRLYPTLSSEFVPVYISRYGGSGTLCCDDPDVLTALAEYGRGRVDREQEAINAMAL